MSFIEEVLYDPESGAPFVLLDAERRILEHTFKTNKAGRLLYPRTGLRRIRESGKTGFATRRTLTMILLFRWTLC